MEPVVWRGPDAVQLGLGGPGRVLAGLTEGEVALLLQPERPARGDLSRCGVTPERWEELSSWRRSPSGSHAPPEIPELLALDDSPLTRAVLARAGMARQGTAGTQPAVRVLTDSWVTDPVRVRPLLAEDLPHLALTVDPAGITVAPLVVPGRTACTRCLDLRRTHADPAWPTAATQLRITAGPAASPVLTEVAAGLALLALRPGSPGWRVEARTVGEVRVDPHPECGCLTPPCADGRVPA